MIELKQRGSFRVEKPQELESHFFPGPLTPKTWRNVCQEIINNMIWHRHTYAEAIIIVNRRPLPFRIEGTAYLGTLGGLAEVSVNGEVIRTITI